MSVVGAHGSARTGVYMYVGARTPVRSLRGRSDRGEEYTRPLWSRVPFVSAPTKGTREVRDGHPERESGNRGPDSERDVETGRTRDVPVGGDWEGKGVSELSRGDQV